jgi:hypothetical protein
MPQIAWFTSLLALPMVFRFSGLLCLGSLEFSNAQLKKIVCLTLGPWSKGRKLGEIFLIFNMAQPFIASKG